MLSDIFNAPTMTKTLFRYVKIQGYCPEENFSGSVNNLIITDDGKQRRTGPLKIKIRNTNASREMLYG